MIHETIRRRREKPSHLLEDITLGPFERWRKYRRVPARMILHAVLLTVLIWHIVQVTNAQNAFNRVWLRNFVRVITPRGGKENERMKRAMFASPDPDVRLHRNTFFEINATAVAAHMQSTITAYYNMGTLFIDEVCVAHRSCIEKDGDPVEAPSLTYTRFNATTGGGSKTDAIMNVSSASRLGPFSAGKTPAAYAQQIQRMASATLTMSAKSYSADVFRLMGDTCALWHFQVQLDFHVHSGRVAGRLVQNPVSSCDHDASLPPITRYIASVWSLLALAGAHALFSLLRIRKGYRVLKTLKRARASHEKALYDSRFSRDSARFVSAYSSITCGDKFRLLGSWGIVSLFADTILMIYALQVLGMWGDDGFSLGSSSAADLASNMSYAFLTLSVFLHILSVLEYVEFKLESVLFMQTMRVARHDMFRIFFGVIPIFMAYACFGTVMYGDRLEQFGDLSASALTLFAVLVGDEVRPTFMALKSDNSLSHLILGIYLGSFVVLFICFFMQVLLAVVEDALIRQGLWMLDHRKQMRRERRERAQLRVLKKSLSMSTAGSDDDGETFQRNESGVSLGLSNSAVSLLHSTRM